MTETNAQLTGTVELFATQTFDDPADPVKIEIETSPDGEWEGVRVSITENPYYVDLAQLVADLEFEPTTAIMIGHALIRAGQRALDALPE